MVERPATYEDPIEAEQLTVLKTLLGDEFSETAKKGFLIVGPRFVDQFGNHRTRELEYVFKTDTRQGRRSLRLSLERVHKVVGGMRGFEKRFPVTIIPPRPAFPLLKIVGVENLAPQIYRTLDSRANTPSGERVVDHIVRTGRLPPVPRQRQPVRRSKPHFHWCSFDKWPSPEETASALQVLPEWSNCRLRATVSTVDIRKAAYVAFNGDLHDPDNNRLRFYGYFYEPTTQDHPQLAGGGIQIGVEGAPRVILLEMWFRNKWKVLWARSEPRRPNSR